LLQQLLQQLGAQHDCSQPQLFSQPQPQLFWQPHDCSQQQLFSQPQPQLLQLLQQLLSQQHDFSQQPQLGSQQQPQPPPSMQSNKPA
jgi:hypothetical protein